MSEAIRARFADLRRLGHGAEGGTWVARDTAGRAVVLKHVPGERRSTVARAFEVLREVSSPHLPAALELLADGKTEGIWLVTGYVEGEPIGAGPVPLEQALAEVLGVAHAIAAIHALGTHHADVSANNVLVTPTRGVVLTDLGQLGSHGCGTPGFLAPEVLRGGGGPAADWFALASLLCLRLFGQVPWRRPERLLELAAMPRELARAGVRQRLRTLAEAAEVELSSTLRTVLERLLDPDVHERLIDARLVVARLHQLHRASSSGEQTRASAPWWLPSRWRYLADRDQLARLDEIVASVRAGECRLIAIAGPDASGRGRVVEEIVQRLQLTDAREAGPGRARISDALGLARELAGERADAHDWIDAWLAVEPSREASGRAPIRGFVQPPEWPSRLRESVELRAAVLRAGADLGVATLILPVELELGRRLRDAASVQVIELRAWSREQVLECLRAVVEDDEGLPAWAAALHEACGGWPARTIRAIEAIARAGLDDREPDRSVVERALVIVGSEPRLEPALAREVLDRCWGVAALGGAAVPESLLDPIDRAPLASSVASARLSLGDAVAALARTTLAQARALDRPIPLALALDADDAEAIEAWFLTRAPIELGSELLVWLERGGVPRVGPRLRLRALRELIRRGEADRSLRLLQAIAQTGTPSPAERLEGIRAREQLGRSGEALEQLDELLPSMQGFDRDRALGLRWRALVDAGRAGDARVEAETWSRDRGAIEREPDWRRAVAWLWGGLAVLYAGGDAAPWLAKARGECRVEAGEAGPNIASVLARVEQLEANLAQAAGDNQRARERYRVAADQFARAGEGLGRVLVEGSLAALALEAGEFDEALDRGRRACRGFLARAQVQTLPAALFNLVRALIASGALDEGRRLLALGEQLCAAAGELEPSQLVRARLRRTAIELDAAAGSTHDRAGLGERMATCAGALAQAGAAGEAIDALVSAAALARVDAAPNQARARLVEASDRLAGLGEAADPSVRLAVALEALAQAQTREQLERARTSLAELPGPVELWAAGQRLLAWTYDRALLGALHRFGCIGDRSSQPVARRLIANLEALMAKVPNLDRRALRHSLLSEAGEAGPLRELVRELEAAELDERAEAASSPEPAPDEPGWTREPSRPPASASSNPSEPASARLQRLLKIFRRLAREDELPRLLEQVVEAMMELTDAERGVVVLGQGSEQIAVAREFAQAGEAVDFSRSVIERVLAQGEPVLSVDATTDDRFDGSRSISHLNLRSVLAVPLVFRGERLGAAYVDHRLRRGNFDADDLAHMEDFADLAALAVAHARALAEVRAQKAELERQKAELASLLEHRDVEVANLREAVREAPERRSYRGMVGSSSKMQQVFRLIDRLADSEVPVVIHGESGTGKELVARAIHDAGPRRSKPFVAENCGAIPETLLESVLFGHAKGAFTGAQIARPGLFEAAEGGTIFLDEIGETSPAMQTKLLRVLQEGEVRRIGENRSRTIDVRVIAASNRALDQLVEQGKFRQDLYYRIHVVQLELPALRERREDIPALIEHFLSRGRDRPALELSAAALRKLTIHPWPGNVRELENEVSRWLALCEQRVLPEDLSPTIGAATGEIEDPDDLGLRPRVDRLERELIAKAMQRTGGNQTQAAALLGLSRFGLQKKLKRLESED
ncbi:sigma 54-interacting transcriptional regulator [Nannocystaceae bacterium ST9]